ncbi:MAG: alkaline phosphatase family protein [Jatrophihabitans sp.]|uniref:alkaline phosphatase family protein n=1 Tax=Jatrophihabitans sp. TaxID=1932789 RepID=UPI003F7EA802
MSLSRRAFLLGAAGLLGGAAVPGFDLAQDGTQATAASSLPPPDDSGIDQIVVVMMENRSFDHLLGWLPGADGRQAGLTYLDRLGRPHRTFHQTRDAGCGFHDPDHSWAGARIEFDGGRCDGWLRAGANDEYAIGYFTGADLPFLGRAAPAFTVCDRWFAATMSCTYPNRIYTHAGRTDRIRNSLAPVALPTIWDRLAAAGVPARYYYSDVPFLALWRDTYLHLGHPVTDFWADAAAGRLPAVSYVEPRFVDGTDGTSGDDHPHSDIRAGERFLAQVYDAVTRSPQWPTTLLVIVFDEWGGFFEHVPPATAPDVSPVTALRGFRVPALLISPRARRGHVDHFVYDHTSLLRAIEWRWGLAPLAERDRHATNLFHALDLRAPAVLAAPRIDVPAFVDTGCAEPVAARPPRGDWTGLRDLALATGWPVPSP